MIKCCKSQIIFNNQGPDARETIRKRSQKTIKKQAKVCNLDKGKQGERFEFKQGGWGINSHPEPKTLGSSKVQQQHGSWVSWTRQRSQGKANAHRSHLEHRYLNTLENSIIMSLLFLLYAQECLPSSLYPPKSFYLWRSSSGSNQLFCKPVVFNDCTMCFGTWELAIISCKHLCMWMYVCRSNLRVES